LLGLFGGYAVAQKMPLSFDVKGTDKASGVLVNKPLIANYQSIYLSFLGSPSNQHTFR
jgi:hypothetical protein